LARRVVVTGIGLVCAVGIGTEESWKSLLAGQSGIATITSFDTAGFDCRIAGQVKNFDPFQWIGKKELKKMGRFIQLALAGADFAVKMAEWKPEQSDLDEVGVYVSSGIGGFDIIEREHIKLMQGGPGKISPFFIPSAIVNLASGYISIRYGARGPNSATATACSASAHAIGDSFKIIERGAAEMMICGGTEAAITPMGIGGFASMKALSEGTSRRENSGKKLLSFSVWFATGSFSIGKAILKGSSPLEVRNELKPSPRPPGPQKDRLSESYCQECLAPTTEQLPDREE